MALLAGKLLVPCPRSGHEVDVRKDCIKCGFFKHVAWQGLTPLIACTYEKKPEQEKEKEGEKASPTF